jgi:hypothetical protein
VDHLEPERDDDKYQALFAAYHRGVSRLLFGAEDTSGSARLVTIPSFSPEEAVWVTPTAPSVTAVRMKESLWYQASEAVPDRAGKVPFYRSDEAMAFALTKIAPSTQTRTAPIAAGTARLIEGLWEAAIADAYSNQEDDRAELGLDGETYFFSFGGRTATTWSPLAGTRCSALVQIGADLAELARSPTELRAALEERLLSDAQALLARFAASR